jgi:hypothetical protein
MYAALAERGVGSAEQQRRGGSVPKTQPTTVVPFAQQTGWQRVKTGIRYTTLVILPVIVVVATAIAEANQGPVRVYWSLGTVAAVIASSILAVNKEQTAVAARAEAIRARIELATALNTAGQPLVVALGNVTTTETLQEAQAAVAVLLDRAVSIAQSEAGRMSPCRTRAAFYSFEGENLVRKNYSGYSGANAPRREFRVGRSEHDDEVIRFAHGENALLVRDLEKDPPPHFLDNLGRSYKCFTSVPVRAGNKSFGLLTADADVTGALTDVDKGYLILIAGTLGAGLAHLEAIAGKSQGIHE